MNTVPQHIADKANEMIAKGAKMTFEAICAMYMKSEALRNHAVSKKAAKWEQRASVENAIENNTYTRDIAEINRENAMKNLPSSLK